jgi:hypothetical protein
MIKTATQAALDKLRETYEKKLSAVNVGFEQDVNEHYEMIRIAQRTKDDADWMIRFHQTQADKLRAECEQSKRDLRAAYENAVASFLNKGVLPDGWEAAS